MNGRNRLPGVVVAGITALTSGVSVFVNSYAVHSMRDATVYTTAKNLVAAILLGALVLTMRATHISGFDEAGSQRMPGRAPGSATATTTPTASTPATLSAPGPTTWAPARWAGIAYVGIVGGGVAFVLFFEGLARTSAQPAAFLHDTMVIWVAVLAAPLLAERVTSWNACAIVLLVGGQVAVTGGIGHLVAGEGQFLVLGATVLWAVETVVAKGLLRSMSASSLAVARMSVGVVVLVAFTAVSGRMGSLTGLDAVQIGWVLLTGALLAVYVGTWMVALSRARAMDVTSVLVASVVVTTLLQLAAGHSSSVPEVIGLVLVAIGSVTVLRAWTRPAEARLGRS